MALLSYALITLLFINTSLDKITGELIGILYGSTRDNQHLTYNISLWYIPCLFITELAFDIFKKYLSRIMILILVSSSFIGFIFSQLTPSLILPWGIEIAFTSIVFYGVGSLTNKNLRQAHDLFEQNKFSIFILFTMICIGLAYFNLYVSGYKVDMRETQFGDYFLFYSSAFAGIPCFPLRALTGDG